MLQSAKMFWPSDTFLEFRCIGSAFSQQYCLKFWFTFINFVMTYARKQMWHVCEHWALCICRWLQWPGSIVCIQRAVYCSSCDKQRFTSFRNTVILSSSQRSPAIPQRFSATSCTNVRWNSSLNTFAIQSQNVLTQSHMASLQQCRISFLDMAPELRLLHTSPVGRREPESKVEETLEALKDSVKKSAAAEPSDEAVATEAKTPPKVTEVESPPPVAEVVITPEKKKTLWVRFKAEMVHYYHGFRLLFIDTRVAVRLIWQVLNGRTLMRRERKQVSFVYRANRKHIKQFGDITVFRFRSNAGEILLFQNVADIIEWY